jgi:hypothetical protein
MLCNFHALIHKLTLPDCLMSKKRERLRELKKRVVTRLKLRRGAKNKSRERDTERGCSPHVEAATRGRVRAATTSMRGRVKVELSEATWVSREIARAESQGKRTSHPGVPVNFSLESPCYFFTEILVKKIFSVGS